MVAPPHGVGLPGPAPLRGMLGRGFVRVARLTPLSWERFATLRERKRHRDAREARGPSRQNGSPALVRVRNIPLEQGNVRLVPQRLAATTRRIGRRSPLHRDQVFERDDPDGQPPDVHRFGATDHRIESRVERTLHWLAGLVSEVEAVSELASRFQASSRECVSEGPANDGAGNRQIDVQRRARHATTDADGQAADQGVRNVRRLQRRDGGTEGPKLVRKLVHPHTIPAPLLSRAEDVLLSLGGEGGRTQCVDAHGLSLRPPRQRRNRRAVVVRFLFVPVVVRFLIVVDVFRIARFGFGWLPAEQLLEESHVRSSLDGSSIEDPDAPGVAGVAFNDGTWVMVGQGSLLTTGVRVATSHDGVSWQTHLVPFDGGRVGSVSRVFVFGDQFAFGVTPQPSSEVPRPTLFTSADGQDWTAHPLPAEVQVVFDLASDGERVAVAAGNLWTSTDLEDWTQVRFRSERDLDGVGQVEFASGLWMVSSQYTLQASGESFANARISTNGVDWELIDLSGSENFYIAQLDPTWLITTWPGDHFRSSDGENFEPVEPAGAWIRSPLPPSPRIRAAGRRFLNVIEEPVAGQPTTLRVIGSDEGATWVDFGGVPGLPVPEDAVEIAYEIADIAYGHCRYIAAGAYRVIIRGALDPPAWWRETGPLLLTADLAQ